MTKMPLIFASHNANKLKEIKALLPHYSIQSLAELGFHQEIPETGDSLEANAEIKARTIFEKYGQAVFADDTGLLVDALNGAPGIYSARYAGENAKAEDNMQKLLLALTGNTKREAHFKTVICFIDHQGKSHFFEGRVNGHILEAKTGSQGFGYDPIFKPKGESLSFAEMSATAKNRLSHRALALKAFIHFLQDTGKS